jgi:hypothetical protein
MEDNACPQFPYRDGGLKGTPENMMLQELIAELITKTFKECLFYVLHFVAILWYAKCILKSVKRKLACMQLILRSTTHKEEKIQH